MTNNQEHLKVLVGKALTMTDVLYGGNVEKELPLRKLKCLEEIGEVAEAVYDLITGGYKGKSVNDLLEELVDVFLVSLSVFRLLKTDFYIESLSSDLVKIFSAVNIDYDLLEEIGREGVLVSMPSVNSEFFVEDKFVDLALSNYVTYILVQHFHCKNTPSFTDMLKKKIKKWENKSGYQEYVQGELLL